MDTDPGATGSESLIDKLERLEGRTRRDFLDGGYGPARGDPIDIGAELGLRDASRQTR
jgi:hypothetical protein